MKPLVSINCTTYNQKDYVKETLYGFVMQKTNFPFEVILHDDASTDGTQDIIREYERNYPNLFKVIYQKENQQSKGVKIWKQYQFPRCQGKYIALCEGDDYWFDPNKLQMQADYMEAHEDCSLVFHAAYWLDGDKGDSVRGANQPWTYETDVDKERILLPGLMGIDTCSVFCRGDIARKWPRFRDIANIGDCPLLFLLLSHGNVHYLPNIMGAYRYRRPGSWTEKLAGNVSFAIKHHITAFKWLFEFNLYTKGEFVVPVGKRIWYHVDKLAAHEAIGKFPWLGEILIAAAENIKPMAELEALQKDNADKDITRKHKAAEKQYWSWFVETIGEAANNNA